MRTCVHEAARARAPHTRNNSCNRTRANALSSCRVNITEFQDKRTGGTIDGWRGRCKMILAHTIETMVGDKPARVHCNTCKSQPSYRVASVRETVGEDDFQFSEESAGKASHVWIGEGNSLARSASTSARFSAACLRPVPGEFVIMPQSVCGIATTMCLPQLQRQVRCRPALRCLLRRIFARSGIK
jgi:hypothetical protein